MYCILIVCIQTDALCRSSMSSSAWCGRRLRRQLRNLKTLKPSSRLISKALRAPVTLRMKKEMVTLDTLRAKVGLGMLHVSTHGTGIVFVSFWIK